VKHFNHARNKEIIESLLAKITKQESHIETLTDYISGLESIVGSEKAMNLYPTKRGTDND
jgi:hypothetical protein